MPDFDWVSGGRCFSAECCLAIPKAGCLLHRVVWRTPTLFYTSTLETLFFDLPNTTSMPQKKREANIAAEPSEAKKARQLTDKNVSSSKPIDTFRRGGLAIAKWKTLSYN